MKDIEAHLMKKVQRSFVVEYKSGRRNADPKSNSIWGNMDLKSVAQDVQQEAAPFLRPLEQNDLADSETSLPEAEGQGLLLTQSSKHPTSVTNTREINMADENETTLNNEAPASVVAASDVAKKQRKPRAKKVAAETTSVKLVVEPADSKLAKQTRGRKPKLNGVAVSAKNVPMRRGPKPASAAPVVAIDEMTDILQLEEENQRLRKLVAEKLRAENADLRKRLNLG